jgi:hypothetical protein
MFCCQDYENKGHSAENLPWFWIPVKIFLALKLGMIEEQNQSSLLWQAEYRNKGHATTPKKLSWVKVLVKVFLYIVK